VIEAVTFDFWNTLVYEERGHLRGRRLAAWAGILEDAGFACERERLDVAFDDSWQAYVRAWKANEQFLAVQGAEHCLETLGFDIPSDVRDALLDAFTSAGDDADLHLTDGVAECLRALRSAGVSLGIICDVGMTPSSTLRAHLERNGVLELFDHWAFSDEVGWYKPAPQIFEHALAGLGVAPSRAAHVGDIRRTDVAGAQAVGMVAVRYIGVSDDDSQPEPEGDHVIADHRDLPKVLGIA
jgi:putative hydrolase of the HAD superfamily